MASCLVSRDERERCIFEDCQVEADESVVRKEKTYSQSKDGQKVRTGTVHHSVICLTQRGSTKQVMYLLEPHWVPVAESGKPSPPSLPTVDLVLPMLSKHFGDHVVFHTDGAQAYAAACKALKAEGYSVVHDSVCHSKGQYSAFGRHDVTGNKDWESCDFALTGDSGEKRIRVVKGVQKAEGLWRHLKHGNNAIPMEVANDDRRLDMYVQSLTWRLQCCACPVRDVGRMCRAFRHLPVEQKSLVWEYGLKGSGSKKRQHAKPEIVYCRWHLKSAQEESDAEAEGSDAVGQVEK